MKGGITSGVVYPSTLWVLSEKYKFRNIGGASAGAIAAVVAAAAEYGAGPDREERLEPLNQLGDELRTVRSYVRRLFQPVWYIWPTFWVLLGLVADHGELPPPLNSSLVGAVRRTTRTTFFLLLFSPITTGLAIWGSIVLLSRSSNGWHEWPAVVLIALAGLVAALTWHAGLLMFTLRQNNYGLCPGTRRRNLFGYRPPHPALTEWIHEKVQTTAGLDPDHDDPLTFGQLAERGIRLQLITTDLSAGRPVKLPLANPGADDQGGTVYFFRSNELRPLFPANVLTYLEEVSADQGGGYRRLPGDNLPVVVGARLSLSYPVLLSALPMHARKAGATVFEPHLFSVGGISSNFPIHFFDGWLPSCPTFGLDLIGPPGPSDIGGMVVMPRGPGDPVPSRWGNVKGLRGFASGIFDTARNWHDTLQTELPGFRERICHIRLTESEGGMNLNMTRTTLTKLVDRGEQAGNEIIQRFSWPQHLWLRYLILMELLQINLDQAQDLLLSGRDTPYDLLMRRANADFEAFAFGDDHPRESRVAGLERLRKLVEEAGRWVDAEGSPIFETGGTPKPTPVLRITPNV